MYHVNCHLSKKIHVYSTVVLYMYYLYVYQLFPRITRFCTEQSEAPNRMARKKLRGTCCTQEIKESVYF